MKYQKMDDDKIVALAKQNDDKAFRAILEKYKPLVRAKSRIYFIAGGDIQDIIQEGMIGLFKAINDYDKNKDASFKSFLEICVTRQVISAVRKADRKKHQPLNTYLSFSKPMFDDESDSTAEEYYLDDNELNPEELLVNQDELKRLAKEIYENLSKMEKAVFRYYLKGLTYKEIARIMEKKDKSIDNALTRIKNKAELIRNSKKL